MTDLLWFQFKLLFCFEKKNLTQNENKNEHCILTGQPKTKIRFGENENRLEKL